MNITEQDIKLIIYDIRADFEKSIETANQTEFEQYKSKARSQMHGVLKTVTPYKIASFVLVEMGHLKAVHFIWGAS